MHSKFINILTSKLTILVIFVCSAFFACFGCMLDSYADDINVGSTQSATHEITFDFLMSNDCSGNYSSGRWHAGAMQAFQSICFYPMITYQLIGGGYFVEVYVNINSTASTSQSPAWYGASYGYSYASDTYWQLISQEQVSSTTISGTYTYRDYRLLFRYNGPALIGSGNANRMALRSPNDIFYAEGFRVNQVIFWHIDNADASNQQIINSINSQSQTLNNINNGISGTNNRLDDVNDNLNDLRNSQEQANDDANDRYEDEKDTTYDEAQNGQDNMNDMANDIGSGWINFPNPFASMFNYFIDTCSVNIPTIASWINWNGTTVNSWWCQTSTLSTIRGSLTTILSFVGVLLTFTFIFKWLRTNQGEV